MVAGGIEGGPHKHDAIGVIHATAPVRQMELRTVGNSWATFFVAGSARSVQTLRPQTWVGRDNNGSEQHLQTNKVQHRSRQNGEEADTVSVYMYPSVLLFIYFHLSFSGIIWP